MKTKRRFFWKKRPAVAPDPTPPPVKVPYATTRADDLLKNALEARNIKQDGKNFYENGRIVVGDHDAKYFMDTYIPGLFAGIWAEIQLKSKVIREELSKQIELVKDRIKKHEENLDGNIPGSVLHEKKQILKKIQEKAERLEKLSCPDEALHGMMNGAKEDKQSTRAKSELEAAVRQKERLGIAKGFQDAFYHIFGKLNPGRHSTFYPPRTKYIKLYFCLCGFLLLGETGFSYHIIDDVIYVVNKTVSDIMAGVFCLTMSFTQAALLKFLMDVLLHRGSKRRWIFIALLLMMFIFQVFVYSYDHNQSVSQGISFTNIRYEALLIAAFSLLFSTANALLYREATYLQHLQFRTTGGVDPDVVKQEIEDYITAEEAAIKAERDTLTQLEAEYAWFDDQKLQDIENQIKGFVPVSIGEFLRGRAERMFELIGKNQELVVLLFQKIIGKFNNKTSI